MIKAALIAALLQHAAPCLKASPLGSGQVAPCTGILLSSEQAREALACKSVEIPKLQAEARYAKARHDAAAQTCRLHTAYLEAALADDRPIHPWWITPLVGSAFLAIGYALGSLAGGAR